jgi:predicted ATPase/DNA-binding SARP family transcriptional activator
MTQLCLTLFGTLQATLAEIPVTKFRSVRNGALLAYLALEAERPHARATLAGLLWPEEPEEAARQNLRQALFQLRTILTPKDQKESDFLLITPTTVQFNGASNHWVDVTHFTRLISTCERHEHRDLHSCQPCMHRLTQAVDLYRGPLLEGLFVEQSPALEQWLLLKREALHHQMVTALHTLADGHLASGDLSAAYRFAQRQIELDPLREEAYQQAMRALAQSGQSSEALALYLTCSQRLYDELGASPNAATEALFQQISDATLPVAEAKAPTPRPNHNLPAATTTFVGREKEVARVVEQMLDPNCRLLTLLGVGGVGKTRLSLQAATNLVGAFADGVWFVALAGVQATTDLATAITTALGLTPPKGDPTQFLLDYLASRELLLVLDNFEHLTAGASLVADLLTRAHRVKVLVTSRERLNLQAEMLSVVDALPTPEQSEEEQVDLRGFSSVKLFAERAARSLLGFTLDEETLPAVAAICRAVNGLPLGIELAATWVDQFTCAEIAESIRRNQDFLHTGQEDVPVRQRSLRAVFDHSWQLLKPAEQETLANTTVFHGAFGRNAALEVAQTTVPTLAALTHKSLLRVVSPGRYALHEVVRQFAAEQLHDRFDAVAGQWRHSQYYLGFVAGWEGKLWGQENNSAATQIMGEIDNVRAAWRWATQQRQPLALRSSLKALVRFYTMAGFYREAVTLLQLALDHLPLPAPAADPELAALHSRLLTEQARMFYHLSDYSASAAAAQASLTLAETLADPLLQAASLRALADAWYQQSERERAQQMMAEALRLAQGVGALELEADCQLGYGDILMYRGEPAVAAAHDRALTLYRQLGDRCGEAWTLNSMGIAAAFQKQYAPSQSYFEQAVQIFRLLGDRPSTGRALNNLAAILVLQKEYAQSEPILVQSLTLSRQNGYRLGEVQTLTNLTEALRGQGKREAARRYCEDALTLAHSLGHVRGEGLQLKILGEMAGEEGDFATAVTFFEQALAAARAQGDRYYEAERLYCLGQALRHLGNGLAAHCRLSEALTVARQVNDEATEGKVLVELQLLGETTEKGLAVMA